jgi:hypothetical protein
MERVRSEWDEHEIPLGMREGLKGASIWQRNVGDGHLSVIVGLEPDGWHLSISHRTNSSVPKPGRYPRWDEIVEARDRFTPGNVTMGMVLPPAEDFVNLHDTTFHLWELPAGFGS